MRTTAPRRWLREPLIRFLLLGALIYVGALVRAGALDDRAGTRDELRVPAEAVARARDEWRQRTGRDPDGAETRAAVEPFVREELLVREARRLGLERGDLVIRRRLAQKMRFVIEELATAPEPTDVELEAWVRAHPERYRSPARVSFEHRFFARSQRGDATAQDAAAALDLLDAGASPESAGGDSFAHGREFTARSEDELRRLFGPAFATAVLELEPGAWRGPIASSFGLHVVRVTRRDAGAPARLEDVREAARADWRAERRARAQEEELRQRLARYEVILEEVLEEVRDAGGERRE
ncbi:MAG: peptidyl-prolyl cis-trans isomerase [Myxococcales bacterium]|nr:peptidyl-prolyl cis-trans isomerase [Myxococcales bacterium]